MNLNTALFCLALVVLAFVGWAQNIQAQQEKRALRAELAEARTQRFMAAKGGR